MTFRGVRSRSTTPNNVHGVALAAGKALGLQFGRYLGEESIFLLNASSTTNHEQLVQALRGVPGFQAVEPNAVVSANATPNDPGYSDQWAHNNTGQIYGTLTNPPTTLQGTAGNDIDTPAAWDYTVGSTSLVIAVLDTGMNRNHEDLAANAWSSPIPGAAYPNGYDFVNGDSDPSDDNGHGTAMAGVMGAVGHNSLGYAGVSWNTRLMPLKVLNSNGQGTWSSIIDALTFVRDEYDAGVNLRVVNMSLGTSIDDTAARALIDDLKARNIVVTASAGNDGTDNDSIPNYPASFSNDNIISVAAVDDDGNRRSDSNYGGDSVDVGAPGHYLATPGWFSGSGTPNDDYGLVSQTSPASAVVAGVAALAFSIDPEAPWNIVKAAITSTADYHSSLVNTTSDGRINASDAVGYMRQYNGGSNLADRTVIGDWQGAAYNDDILVRQNGSNAEVWRNEGGTWNRFTTVANSTSKRINIFSLKGDDTITVEAGVVARVYAYGGGGADLLRAKVGSSSASAGAFLYGGIHNDTLFGSDHDDYMSGQGGNDVLTGYLGADNMFGDAGNDILYMADGIGGNDTAVGGSGTDTLGSSDAGDSWTT